MKPTTEAGRAHIDYCKTFMGDDAAEEVLAIEQEAVAAYREALAARVREVGYQAGPAPTASESAVDAAITEVLALIEQHRPKGADE